MLKPQDIVILLKVYCLNSAWTYAELAESLKTSTSVVHAALHRCDECHLYNVKKRIILKGALEEFLIHGLKYVFATRLGGLVRGIPTAHSAEPLKSLLMVSDDNTYVWACPQGKIKGLKVKPLYHSVPDIVAQDTRLYEMLCLVDGLRIGKVREQDLAALELKKRFYE